MFVVLTRIVMGGDVGIFRRNLRRNIDVVNTREWPTYVWFLYTESSVTLGEICARSKTDCSTHRGLFTLYVCVNWWFVAHSAQRLYPNQCWQIMTSTLRNKYHWHSSNIFIHDLLVSFTKYSPFAPGHYIMYIIMLICYEKHPVCDCLCQINITLRLNTH